MDYHFNSHTIVQLIHLLKNESYTAQSSDFIAGTFQFNLHRKEAPNEGEYLIKISNVLEIKGLSDSGISGDIIQNIEYDDLLKTLKISGKVHIMSIMLDAVNPVNPVNPVNVSALGIEG